MSVNTRGQGVETIGLVCRHNLVRSKFLVSYLRRNYPNYEFWSAGTNVVKGSHFEFDLKFLKRFGVSMGSNESRSLDDVATTKGSPTLLLVAESSQRNSVIEVYPNSEIVALDEIGSDLGLDLRDPMGFDKSDFNQELYKYAFVASFAMNQYLDRKPTFHREISSMIPKNRFSFEKVEAEILNASEHQNVLVLYSGVATSRYLDRHIIKSCPIPMSEIGNFSEFVLLNREAKIFHFEHEMLNPEITLPSHEWRRNIYALGLNHEILLYSSPLFTSRGVFDPLSLFGTFPSSKISIV